MISLIVPLYNEASQAEELVQHLLTIDGIAERILVDASNQAGSKQVIQHLAKKYQDDPSFKIVDAPQPGRSLQMNYGASLATQKVLLFLHCDTRLPPNTADLVIKSLDAHHQWGRFDIQLDRSQWPFRLIGAMINLRSRVRNLATGDQAIFIAADLFKATHGYPEIPLMEDIALSKTLNQHSPPSLITTPVITSARRWEKSGIVRTILLMWKLRLLFWLGHTPERLAAMYHTIR